jgi:ABC-type nitrate/sulfonate/bicarbonate transport system substrate-binding protein
MSALLILEQIGINAERDKMQLTSFGDQRVISQALETGTIQGAALAGVFSRKLARAGYWIPGEPDKIPLTGTGLVVKADYLYNQAAVSRNVLRSLVEGHAYVLNPGNKASVTEILSKRLGLTDPNAAADGYEDYVGGVVRKPYVGVEGMKNIQRFMKQRNPKIADLNLEKLIDESFMREFERSGFLDQQFGVKSGVK